MVYFSAISYSTGQMNILSRSSVKLFCSLAPMNFVFFLKMKHGSSGFSIRFFVQTKTSNGKRTEHFVFQLDASAPRSFPSYPEKSSFSQKSWNPSGSIRCQPVVMLCTFQLCLEVDLSSLRLRILPGSVQLTVVPCQLSKT